MITTESSTSIARPAVEVFEFVSDLRNDPRRHTDIIEASVFAIRFEPYMGQSEGTVTVSDFEPPRRIVLRGRMGKMAPTVTLTVESEDEGSRFTRRVEIQPPGIID